MVATGSTNARRATKLCIEVLSRILRSWEIGAVALPFNLQVLIEIL